MGLPTPRDRRQPPRGARPPDKPSPAHGDQRRPAAGRPAASHPPSSAARTRRRQAEQAARERATGAHNARRATDAQDRTVRRGARADKRDARRAGRLERDARLLARLRAAVHWVFPERTRRVGRGFSVVVLVLNVAPFPGLGTALYGHWERGLMQFLLTFVFLIGWVWAVFDGVRIVSASWRPPPELRRSRPALR